MVIDRMGTQDSPFRLFLAAENSCAFNLAAAHYYFLFWGGGVDVVRLVSPGLVWSGHWRQVAVCGSIDTLASPVLARDTCEGKRRGVGGGLPLAVAVQRVTTLLQP